MTWTVRFTSKVKKAAGKMPPAIRKALFALAVELRDKGPVQPGKPHFGKLKGQGEICHCHLKAGRPTYVAIWEVRDKTIRLIEVTYVGTHENAPH